VRCSTFFLLVIGSLCTACVGTVYVPSCVPAAGTMCQVLGRTWVRLQLTQGTWISISTHDYGPSGGNVMSLCGAVYVQSGEELRFENASASLSSPQWGEPRLIALNPGPLRGSQLNVWHAGCDTSLPLVDEFTLRLPPTFIGGQRFEIPVIRFSKSLGYQGLCC